MSFQKCDLTKSRFKELYDSFSGFQMTYGRLADD